MSSIFFFICSSDIDFSCKNLYGFALINFIRVQRGSIIILWLWCLGDASASLRQLPSMQRRCTSTLYCATCHDDTHRWITDRRFQTFDSFGRSWDTGSTVLSLCDKPYFLSLIHFDVGQSFNYYWNIVGSQLYCNYSHFWQYHDSAK